MADNNYLHTAEIMKAALPYVDFRVKTTMDFITNLMGFMGSYQSFIRRTDLAACGYENTNFNLEGMLSGIRPLCNDTEREFIDRILNIFNAKRMYETYNTYMTAMKAMQGFESSSSGSSESGQDDKNSSGGSSGFDFSSLFGNDFDLNALSKSGFDLSSLTGENSSGGSDSDKENNPAITDPIDTGDIAEDASDTITENHTDDNNDSVNNNDSPNLSSMGNNNMLDMLKTMIPPEQMSTFENLSMLFNTMSYDGNRKSDDK